MDTGDLLKSVREGAGLSVRQLATAAGVSSSTVHRVERGVMDPTVEMLRLLFEAAGIRLELETNSDYSGAAIGLARAIADDLMRNDETSIVRRAAELVGRFDRADVDTAQRMVTAPPQETGDQRWDAFLAALVEWLAVTRAIEVPNWVYDKSRYLSEGWWVTSMESMRAWEYAGSPASFQSHGVYVHRDSLVNV